MKKMIINNKEEKERLKNEICKAEINASGCLAFVAMQETNDITHREFKNLNIICDKLGNLWDYVIFCIDNEIVIDISGYSYNLVRSLSELDVEDYKSNYRNYGEFCIYYV